MISIKTLEKTSTSIFYELPAGKPDSNEPCPNGEDTRSRVKQLAQKGNNTCFYYALNRLRVRIGKHSSNELQEKRKVEQVGSKWRKELYAFQQSLPKLLDTYGSESSKQYLSAFSLERTKLLLENKNPQIFMEFDRRPSLAGLLNEFVKENKHKNFQLFLDDKLPKQEISINKELIKTLIGQEFIDDFDKALEQKGTKDSAQASRKYHFLACDFLAKAYDLQITKWTPFMEIDSLIKALTQNGPLAVGGKFGKGFYKEEPISQNVKGRDFYYWKPGATRVDIGGHEVIIVGAKKVKDNELVYFIDPSDASDPNNIASQRLYKISYKNLTTHVCNVLGIINISNENHTEIGFGYHGHFKV